MNVGKETSEDGFANPKGSSDRSEASSPGQPGDSAEIRQRRYRYLCARDLADHSDPRRAERIYLMEYGVLPGSDGRTKPEETVAYEKRYQGEGLLRRFQGARELGELVVSLVRRGYSGAVTDAAAYARYCKLCRQGLARWRRSDAGVEFFPSSVALAEMGRARDRHGSLDGHGPPPPWNDLVGAGLLGRRAAGKTWVAAGLAAAWCVSVLWALVEYRTEATLDEALVGLGLVGLTVAGAVALHAHLHPNVRSFIADRVLSTANFAVIVSALVVPIAASVFIRDYRHTQIQADLTEALMDHLSKSGDQGELSPTQVALMIDLLDANEGAFRLELAGFKERLLQTQAQRDTRRELQLEAQLDANKSALYAASSEIERVHEEKSKLEASLHATKKEIEQITDDHQANDREAQKKLAALREKEDRIKRQLRNRGRELRNLQRESDRLKQDVDAKQVALEQEQSRTRAAEEARTVARKAARKAAKAAEDAGKANEKLAADLKDAADQLAKSKGRETELRDELHELRKSRGALEEEVRRTVLYYSRRAKQYKRVNSEPPSPTLLVTLTATKALQALEALEGSGITLSEKDLLLRDELKKLKEDAESNSIRATGQTGTEPVDTDGG